MKVIVAGFSRTGTMSMQVALQRLGFKTYHMFEALGNFEEGHMDMWNDYMENLSGIVASKVLNKVVYELFPEIPQSWFKNKVKSSNDSKLTESLYQQIGQLTVELEWLKKKPH